MRKRQPVSITPHITPPPSEDRPGPHLRPARVIHYFTLSPGSASSLQLSKFVVPAADDDVARQRCMRIIEAASTGTSSPLQHIASAATLTPGLMNMKSPSAVEAVVAAVGCSWAVMRTAGFTLSVAKAAGCGAASAKAVGYNAPSLVEVLAYDAAKASGCDVSFTLEVRSAALLQLHARSN